MTKIIYEHQNKKEFEIFDIVKDKDEYFMVVEVTEQYGNVFRFLNLSNGIVMGFGYATLKEMTEHNEDFEVVYAELNIKK